MPDQVVRDVGNVSIRRLSEHDIDDALALSTTAGWNQRADDWRKLVSLARDGSVAAVSDAGLVGTAIGIDYGRFSWIAMMLVAPEIRGRGVGRRLLEAALAAVPADTPVRLDATPMGRPLYQAFGFEDEAALTRWVAGASRGELPVSHDAAGTCRVRRLTGADLPRVAEHDCRVFGASRRTVLEWVFDAAPGYAHVIDSDAAGEPVQYCLGRPGRLFDQIGPVVAASDEAARTLAREALQQACSRAVVMDVFDEQHAIGAWLQACGFRAQRPLIRMRLPPRARAESRAEALPHALRVAVPQVHAEHGAVRADQQHVADLREFAILGPDFA